MTRSHYAAHTATRSRLSEILLLGILLSVLFVLFYGGYFSSADANTATLPGAGRTSAQDPPAGCCGSEEGDDKPHLLAGTYYSLKEGLSATLLLNNKGPNPLEVAPTLFSLNGERYDIAPITVDGNSFQMIDMRGWIVAAGPQFKQGSIQVFHLGRDLVLGAQVYLVDEEHSLSFEEKLAEPANSQSLRLSGVWWLPSPDGKVLLALSNTSNSTVTATASADGAKPSRSGQITVELQPHQTRLLNLQKDVFGAEHGAMSRLGGISVEHNGPGGTLLARGFALERAKGYSTAVQFSAPAGAKSSKYQGAGLRLRTKGGERLTPIVIAYNAGAEATTVTGRLPYTASDGTTLKVDLPAVRVRAGETKAIEVAEAVRAAHLPAQVSGAGLEFEYSTEPGSVQMTALSVGDDGNQVFRVPLWDVPAQRSGTGGYPWYIDGSSSTYVYLKNVTDAPQDYTFQLDFAGGVYSLGLKTVKPHQAITFDIRALRNQQVPDEQGVTIPRTAKRGQIMWSVQGPDALAVIGRSEQVDEATGISSNYACQHCCADSMNSVWVTSESSAIGVGGETTDTAFQQNRTCYQQLLTPYTPYSVSWSSTNTSVASVGEGLVYGEGAGGASIQGSWTAYTYYYGQYGCNTVTVPASPQKPVDVISVTFQKADGTDLPSPLRIGFSSTTLGGVTHDRKQTLKAVVTPSAQAANIVLEGDKVDISQQPASNGVITFVANAVSPSVDEGDGLIKAKKGEKVLATHTLTVVLPAKIKTPHDTTGGGLVIQNIAMNKTTAPPWPPVSGTQFVLATMYARLLTITVLDKWNKPIGDVYGGAEISEIFGGPPELSLNSPLTASGSYIDRVGVITLKPPGTALASSDPQVAAWPSQPKVEALTPGNCAAQTQNITVKVSGVTLEPDPAVVRSVTLCRNASGVYTLTIEWP